MKILIRFDDICPTMDWDQWNRAEAVLQKYNIKPLIGVIPDCKDPELNINPARLDFWECIRLKQKEGWTIAMHGYQHVYDSNKSGVVSTSNKSEFAGHNYDIQYNKIKSGMAILKKNGIETNVFFAPSHSYDYNTLKALSACGFKYMSDGKSCKPVKRFGLMCIPTRDGHSRSLIPQSYITLVFHAHEWATPEKADRYERLKDVCSRYGDFIVSFEDYIKRPCGNYYFQTIDEKLYLIWDRYISKIIRRLRKLFF